MIYITGDTHRDFDRIEYFCSKYNTTKNDTMVILGDAGINYFGGQRDLYVKRWLSDLPITFMLVRGNHEMRPDPSWPVRTKAEAEYVGSFVIQQDFPSILYAQDGRMYRLKNADGEWKKAFVIGGAYSVDKYYRLGAYAAGNYAMKWFDDEQLSEQEMERVWKSFNTALDLEGNMDYLLTHTCPESVEPKDMFLNAIDQSTVDKSTEQFLDRILAEFGARDIPLPKWFCGHWHTDRVAPGNFRFLFNDILAL